MSRKVHLDRDVDLTFNPRTKWGLILNMYVKYLISEILS